MSAAPKHSSQVCLMNELIHFDPSKPTAPYSVQILVAVAIVILTNLVYKTIMKFFPTTVNDNVDEDRKFEYSALKNKGVSVSKLALAEIFNGTIYAPIAEELFFRFFLMKILFVRKLKMNVHIANVAQASIFGVLHLTNTVYSDQGPRFSAAQSLSSFIIGLISGVSYIQTNSILPALIAHMINNLWACTYQVQSYKGYLEGKTN
jgi:membrane protease YdiL (CAAX protease family)